MKYFKFTMAVKTRRAVEKQFAELLSSSVDQAISANVYFEAVRATSLQIDNGQFNHRFLDYVDTNCTPELSLPRRQPNAKQLSAAKTS